MNERQTGATPDQKMIDEKPRIVLARALCDSHVRHTSILFDNMSVEGQVHWIADADRILDQMLTHRIVAADDLRAVLEWAEPQIEWAEQNWTGSGNGLVQRLREVLGE